MAHETNNPVGFVQANLDTLRECTRDISTLIAFCRALDEWLEKGDADGVRSVREEISRQQQKRDLDYILEDLDFSVDPSHGASTALPRSPTDKPEG